MGRSADIKAPHQRPQEKYKDFMDCVRYLCMYPIRYINISSISSGKFHNKRERPKHTRGWESHGINLSNFYD